jgi:UDPglucose 6-dehydrogenase
LNICIVGSGYVGLVTAACFAEFGIRVICIDNDTEKIEMLQKGEIPIYEPGLEEKVRRNIKEQRLSFTTDITQGLRNALVIFIAVGTPSREDGSVDLSYIDEVVKSIGQNMDGYKVIATKSTVPVGTGERIKKIIKKYQKEKIDFDVVSNPEFLREGSAIEDFMMPDRIVIGAESEQAIAIMKDLYRPLYLIETPFIITTVASAEMIKYASNAFLATKISFINEIANICERVGADVHIVAKGMGLDDRIGPKFLHAGAGFGGSCFPKDTRAIVQIAEDNKYQFEIVKSVLKINQQQQEFMVQKIEHNLNPIADRLLGILGLAFKPDTDDMREAPSIHIISELQKKGAKIRATDPAAIESSKAVLKNIDYFQDPYEMAKGCDALILITEWNHFRNLDFNKLKVVMKSPTMFDLRNVYDPQRMKKLGFRYFGVGR